MSYQQPYASPSPEGAASTQYVGTQDPNERRLPFYGAGFGVASKRFFKNYVNFRGRASKSEFWWGQLVATLILLVPMILLIIGVFGFVLDMAAQESNYESGYAAPPEPSAGMMVMFFIGIALTSLVGLALLLPMLSLGWRRLQDANMHGAIFLAFYFGGALIASFIPFAGLAALVPGFFPTKSEGQRFDTPEVQQATGFSQQSYQSQPYQAQSNQAVPNDAQPYQAGANTAQAYNAQSTEASHAAPQNAQQYSQPYAQQSTPQQSYAQPYQNDGEAPAGNSDPAQQGLTSENPYAQESQASPNAPEAANDEGPQQSPNQA